MITKYVLKMKEELISRNSSRKTIVTYSIGLQTFYRFYRKPLHLASNYDFLHFKIHLLNKRKEPKTINTYLAAINFFYREIMHRKTRITTVKEKEKIPRILTKDDIEAMISKTNNIKYKLLIMIMYSSGLRVSETVKLKYSDLDLKTKACYVREGKGKKDRITILSNAFIELLYSHISDVEIKNSVNNDEYIFPGRKGALSIKSAQDIIKKSAMRIGKKAHPHLLRHSFATHLLDKRIDASLIQRAMGHSDIKTMYKYTKMSKPLMSSPMDL